MYSCKSHQLHFRVKYQARVCVCVYGKEREREREKKKEGERERERACVSLAQIWVGIKISQARHVVTLLDGCVIDAKEFADIDRAIFWGCSSFHSMLSKAFNLCLILLCQDFGAPASKQGTYSKTFSAKSPIGVMHSVLQICSESNFAPN